jgi:prepilin-type N-terminal cleavage/methylation domain-containing protein
MIPTHSRNVRSSRPCTPGFTILELLVVLAIIGFFAIAVGSRFASISEQAGVTTALEEMNNIKKAVVDLFYPDLGFIPEDPGPNGKLVSAASNSAGDDDRPWFATRYLCLQDDRDRTNQTPDRLSAPQSHAMWTYLRSQINRQSPNDGSAKSMALAKLSWDRYRQKGWRGPYMEQDTLATFDGSETMAMPLIATPWADKCEKLAIQAEDAGEHSEAERLRRGKYYLIANDTKINNDGNDFADKNTARIVSFGADCEDSGSYQYAGSSRRATARDLRKANVNAPGNPNAYYTNDDIVVFIFGGGTTRRPTN